MKIQLSTRRADATPYASSLIEGLRDFGYSIETALADIIDNSITAEASCVELIADSTGAEPWIAVVDNGKGMTEADLIEAMRPGSRNPLDERQETDLGRFGLGMKSASFSQCRALYVVSRRDGKTSCAAWDLDEVSNVNKWELALFDEPNFPAMDYLDGDGTAVIWQKLDRLDGGYRQNTDERTKIINAALALAERHLRLVFHRFLEGSKPRLVISINGRSLRPIDPFASNNAARQLDPAEELKLSKGTIQIQCVTLPHLKKMTKSEWDEVGGVEGHLKSQGLYIYRADRLIIAGSWLGLAKASELTKLCRVCVDIPNSMDADWKIDVKKASAQLPPVVRKRLRLVVERFVGTSKRTYRRRGRKLVEEQHTPMWNRVQKDSSIIFKPNILHPVFEEFQETLTPDQVKAFLNCLTLLGASLPVETLYADMMGAEDAVKVEDVDRDALHQQIAAMITDLLEKKIPSENIPNILKNVDILHKNWETADEIIKEILDGELL